MMRVRLHSLELVCRESVELIEFRDISSFYGEMGTGKSTIARLIDYTLGSKSIVMTPALQSEFVEVTLRLTINNTPLILTRARDSEQVRATWGSEGNQSQLMIPARRAAGVVLPGTEVEVLSDLLFHLSGVRPPRVRRSQTREDSELERLSFRDLFWYCYCDQDTIDSSFFNLDHEADTFRRLKSRNVLRFILGIHQERVAELEVEFQETRERRLQAEQAYALLTETLAQSELTTELALNARIAEIKEKQRRTAEALAATRDGLETDRQHTTDKLRQQARRLGAELEALEEASEQIEQTLAGDQRHLNEIVALSTKVQRVTSARSVLNGVEFERCPRCTQALPDRESPTCPVCGQSEPTPEDAADEILQSRNDLDARTRELREIIEKQRIQRRNLERRRNELVEQKAGIDQQLNEAFRAYDPASLAIIVALEREAAGYEQEARYVAKLGTFLTRADELKKEGERLLTEEQRIGRDLREAREEAQKDTGNLKRLASLFLDCLVRAKLSGFTRDDRVAIAPPWYLPEVIRADTGEVATISFETLGSGGIKTLFKACFLLAMHRLATELKAQLPTLIIIDSPMKNISERENEEQFVGFHTLVYEVAESELSDTQFILIDKEFCPPAAELTRTLVVRHMKVDDSESPPLIGYYRASVDVEEEPES
jgi:hypothetical protein